jgi:hypothetical protein
MGLCDELLNLSPTTKPISGVNSQSLFRLKSFLYIIRNLKSCHLLLLSFSLTCHGDFPHSIYAHDIPMFKLLYTKPILKVFTNETKVSNTLTFA